MRCYSVSVNRTWLLQSKLKFAALRLHPDTSKLYVKQCRQVNRPVVGVGGVQMCDTRFCFLLVDYTLEL
jgi:hypothetical protein